MINIGILVFDRVEELDFIGPYEMFAAAQDRASDLIDVKTYGFEKLDFIGNKRMAFTAHALCRDAPQLDVLLVPGGNGSVVAAEQNGLVNWVKLQAAGCQWTSSVCTGARILQAAGLIDGKRITTFHGAIEDFRKAGRAREVLDDVRYVQDGSLVTSAGISAGSDMSLWLRGQITSPDFAREIQAYTEYFPAPPYAALVGS
jgi:transcriptional regulator GlxA family with amidase domain